MKRMVGSDVRGVRLTERPQLGSIDGVKRALNKKECLRIQGRMIVRDRRE